MNEPLDNYYVTSGLAHHYNLQHLLKKKYLEKQVKILIKIHLKNLK